jgi:hypothetical protein
MNDLCKSRIQKLKARRDEIRQLLSLMKLPQVLIDKLDKEFQSIQRELFEIDEDTKNEYIGIP